MRLSDLFAALALLGLSQAHIRRTPFPQYQHRYNIGQKLDVQYTYSTHWYNTKLDHFSVSNTQTFKLKYLVNNDNYEEGGPMFFYTGNEGAIETFVQATGMIWDLAKLFKAVVVFVEHRYYGESQPFDTYENSFNSTDHLAYLSTSQALADFAAVITDLKSNSTATEFAFSADTKVISFGGSYGAMLSAWFRMKYPHVVIGAWAASAPVQYFNGGGVDYGAFNKVATATFDKSGCDINAIAKSWDAITKLANTSDGRAVLNKAFKIADSSLLKGTPGEVAGLIGYIDSALTYMAMTDYPYPATFLTTMPGFPVKVGCESVPKGVTFASDEDLAVAVAALTSVYYNWNNDTDYRACWDESCGDASIGALGTPLGWPWQECTEIIIEMCSRGMPNDFFTDQCGSLQPMTLPEARRIGCTFQFGTRGFKPKMFDENAVSVEYGLTFDGVTNLILTQGELDPWISGGLKKGDNTRGLFVTTIQNAAHHLDLRQPNTCDPSNLASVRYQIVRILQCWLDASKCPSSYSITDSDQSIIPPSDTECKDIIEGFPWGQKDSSNEQTTTTSPQTTTKGGNSHGLFSLILLFVVLLNL